MSFKLSKDSRKSSDCTWSFNLFCSESDNDSAIVFNTSSIRYCYLFGDYAKNCANEKSPVKLLISSRLTGPVYFNMIETIQKKIVKKTEIYIVDRLLYNKELIDEILKNGIKIYG